MGERADVSEVIEVRGHSGRKSHESRTSGCEQCYRVLTPSFDLSSFFIRIRFLIMQLDIV